MAFMQASINVDKELFLVHHDQDEGPEFLSETALPTLPIGFYDRDAQELLSLRSSLGRDKVETVVETNRF